MPSVEQPCKLSQCHVKLEAWIGLAGSSYAGTVTFISKPSKKLRHRMSSWHRDFPTYSYEERDIVVSEYESAVQTVDSEEKLFANATNLAAVVAAGFGSVAVGSSGASFGNIFPFTNGKVAALTAIVVLVLTYSLVTLSYFADRRKSITYAKRKIVVLRRMLGLSYGSLQLALPNNRLEAADIPHKIRLFPGWFSYVTYPFWIISVFSSVILWFLGGRVITATSFNESFPYAGLGILITGVGTWLFVTAIFYRYLLYDTHENLYLSFAKSLAFFLRLSLVGNVEFSVYEARRAVQEHRRKDIDLDQFYSILLFIEDRQFRSHPGVSVRALIRAALGYLGWKRRSGGSTLTQQLARTLLVTDFKKTLRRKIVEFPLALWTESIFEKEEILNLHLVSVRFAYDSNGVLDALKYYFGDIDIDITYAHVFFLIERISNIKDNILASKIDDTLQQAVDSEVISCKTAKNVVKIYSRMSENEKLTPRDYESFQRLIDKWA